MLRLEGLTRRFAEAVAVDGVTLDIAPGSMVGVIGRSGAGKSTLLRLVNRLIEPSEGRVLFDGRDVTAMRGAELRRWRADCAMIFQQFNLVGRLDVLTNVLVGRVDKRGPMRALLGLFDEEDRAIAVAALQRVDMLPQALQRAETLSGGQQQRVAIARALVQQPRIVLADEPIASLDPRNAARVMDLLRAINREDGLTVLCNLHTLDVARRYCDRIVAMQAGRVVFDGAAGADWPTMLRYAVLPQVAPNFVSYILLRFEINVRSAAIVGFVGAGGIGQELYFVIRQFIYPDISAIVVLIVLFVAANDVICERIRHRVIGMDALR